MKFWWLYALLGALFAGLMPLFVKRGLSLADGKTIDSDLATAVRVVMLRRTGVALRLVQGGGRADGAVLGDELAVFGALGGGDRIVVAVSV